MPRTGRETLIATLVIYLFVVAAFTIVPTQVPNFQSAPADHINIVPFQYSFKCFLIDRNMHPRVNAFCLRNTLGNFALFLPLGILLPVVSTRFNTLGQVMWLAFAISFSIETIQFFSGFIGSPRSVDIDDVILNTLGACFGFAIYKILKSVVKRA